jgi:hypothetical protein
MVDQANDSQGPDSREPKESDQLIERQRAELVETQRRLSETEQHAAREAEQRLNAEEAARETEQRLNTERSEWEVQRRVAAAQVAQTAAQLAGAERRARDIEMELAAERAIREVEARSARAASQQAAGLIAEHVTREAEVARLAADLARLASETAQRAAPNAERTGSAPPLSGPTASTPTESERLRIVFDMWSKAVDTQMHFNDLSTKSRALGLTFVVSALALAVFLMGKGDDWKLAISLSDKSITLPSVLVIALIEGVILAEIWLLNPVWFKNLFFAPAEVNLDKRRPHRGTFGAVVALPVIIFVACSLGWSQWTWQMNLKSNAIQIHVSVILVLASAVSLFLVRILDLGVYHKMLRGAVAFGEDLEQQHIRESLAPGLKKGMTEAISYFSRNSDAKFVSRLEAEERDIDQYRAGKERTAEDKVRLFYYRTAALLLVVVALLFIYPNYPTTSDEVSSKPNKTDTSPVK